ncbi:Hypothetical_protein [Hexamita inflata]|uniref:Hypothetical_protein n=1 Tax=Hexamita inflata TaxID=28002 RepID=A0AA86U513_9EUKA|nr:Hypothetical protein HINF_LOCUS1420 [Hexamita inflata]CAI9941139.1 Hypothetical protein HINF_LOCUS28784 [Hexamita inflata]
MTKLTYITAIPVQQVINYRYFVKNTGRRYQSILDRYLNVYYKVNLNNFLKLEKGNNILEDTSTKKKPDKLTQTKVIPNSKGNDKKIQFLKEKIAKFQREMQFDTAAKIMHKFKETKKKHDDKKITQKTSNTEAQSENEKNKKKLTQVRKLK